MTSTPQELAHTLDRIAEVNLLCIGDIMLDRFIYGSVDRISPEAPIPVFTTQREEKMLGGAGNVVRNLLGLGTRVSFASVIGDDTVGTQLTALVGAEDRLIPTLITERGRISTKKTRFVAGGQQLLRSDKETREPVREESITKIIEMVIPEIAEYNAVILSDYGKGCLTPQTLPRRHRQSAHGEHPRLRRSQTARRVDLRRRHRAQSQPEGTRPRRRRR